MAQVAAVMVLKNFPTGNTSLLLQWIDQAAFDNPSFGDQIHIVVEAIKMRSRHGKLRGEAFVRDKLVAEAEIFSTIVNGK
jgi:3-hydroxymyristoyl/3-hydroxydecanoyl-(acyl carrier protein) dehydratase